MTRDQSKAKGKEMNVKIIDIIGPAQLANYLCANYGNDFAVWDDGSTSIIESSTGFAAGKEPVARVKCPGIGNINTEYFTEGFCSQDQEQLGAYVVDDPLRQDRGRVVGNFEAVVRECCDDGDVSVLLDELIENLQESIRLSDEIT